MMTKSEFRRLALGLAAAAVTLAPAAAFAGTRASDGKAASAAQGPANPGKALGPKDGFPNSPGLQIAKIRANDNAAFKRKSNGC